MAVSAPRNDSHSIRGARGDAHAKEWPGAMIPAFPAVASRPRPSFSSSSVTSWPARARKYAVVTPTTPPPSTSVFMDWNSSSHVVAQHEFLRMRVQVALTGQLLEPEPPRVVAHQRDRNDQRHQPPAVFVD